MKKLLLLAIMLLLSLTLVGCRSNNEPKLSIEGWAEYYALQKYELETGYTIFATQTTKLEIIVDSDDVETIDNDYGYFEVNIYSDEGSVHTYLVFIVFNWSLLKHHFEEDIISVEIEKAKQHNLLNETITVESEYFIVSLTVVDGYTIQITTEALFDGEVETNYGLGTELYYIDDKEQLEQDLLSYARTLDTLHENLS